MMQPAIMTVSYTHLEFLHAELDEIFMTLATQRKGLYSVYADVMAWDTERQEALARLGLAATGFRFMMYDGGLMPSGTGCERLSQVVMSLCLQEQTHFGPLYCPEEHIPAGMRIYDSAKARCLLTTRGCMPARQAWTDYIIVTDVYKRQAEDEVIFRHGVDALGSRRIVVALAELKAQGHEDALRRLLQGFDILVRLLLGEGKAVRTDLHGLRDTEVTVVREADLSHAALLGYPGHLGHPVLRIEGAGAVYVIIR